MEQFGEFSRARRLEDAFTTMIIALGNALSPA